MAEENISQEFRLKNIDEKRNKIGMNWSLESIKSFVQL